MIDGMEYNDQTLWAQVGERLAELQSLLTQIPEDSTHVQQAYNILNKVRACSTEWGNGGEVRRAGRPQGVFVQHGDEEAFRAALGHLLHDCFCAESRKMKLTLGTDSQPCELTCHDFFALLYDACIQWGIASGSSDLKAFYDLVVSAAAQTGISSFCMAHKTLNNRVKQWENYVPAEEGQTARVLLHRISLQSVLSNVKRRELSAERARQQWVVEVARRYGLLPPCQDAA